jgi:hypothetical protein
MKFWQLDSLLRETPHPITEVARTRPEWRVFAEWHADLEELCPVQDRVKLDAELPDDYVRAVLSKVDMPFYLDAEGWLRGGPFHSSEERLTALEAFNRCGGEMLEDVVEKGVSHRKFFRPRAE